MVEPEGGLDPLSSPFGFGLSRVPVLRVFGTTPGGQKACLHIHGYMPYFYVGLRFDDDREDIVKQIRMSIESNLAIVYSNLYSKSSNRQYVYNIEVVQKISIYGYHRKSCFLRISMINPSSVSRLAVLFQSGAILDRKFITYHTHIPYILSFLADHNLVGMGVLKSNSFQFRQPLPPEPPPWVEDFQSLSSPSSMHRRIWTEKTTPRALLGSQSRLKTSRCALEADLRASTILNRKNIPVTKLSQSEMETKFVGSLAVIWDEHRRRRAMRGLTPTPTGSGEDKPRPNPPSRREEFASGHRFLRSLENLVKESQEWKLIPKSTPEEATKTKLSTIQKSQNDLQGSQEGLRLSPDDLTGSTLLHNTPENSLQISQNLSLTPSTAMALKLLMKISNSPENSADEFEISDSISDEENYDVDATDILMASQEMSFIMGEEQSGPNSKNKETSDNVSNSHDSQQSKKESPNLQKSKIEGTEASVENERGLDDKSEKIFHDLTPIGVDTDKEVKKNIEDTSIMQSSSKEPPKASSLVIDEEEVDSPRESADEKEKKKSDPKDVSIPGLDPSPWSLRRIQRSQRKSPIPSARFLTRKRRRSTTNIPRKPQKVNRSPLPLTGPGVFRKSPKISEDSRNSNRKRRLSLEEIQEELSERRNLFEVFENAKESQKKTSGSRMVNIRDRKRRRQPRWHLERVIDERLAKNGLREYRILLARSDLHISENPLNPTNPKAPQTTQNPRRIRRQGVTERRTRSLPTDRSDRKGENIDKTPRYREIWVSREKIAERMDLIAEYHLRTRRSSSLESRKSVSIKNVSEKFRNVKATKSQGTASISEISSPPSPSEKDLTQDTEIIPGTPDESSSPDDPSSPNNNHKSIKIVPPAPSKTSSTPRPSLRPNTPIATPVTKFYNLSVTKSPSLSISSVEIEKIPEISESKSSKISEGSREDGSKGSRRTKGVSQDSFNLPPNNVKVSQSSKKSRQMSKSLQENAIVSTGDSKKSQERINSSQSPALLSLSIPITPLSKQEEPQTVWEFRRDPPSVSEIVESFRTSNIHDVEYDNAFFSNPAHRNFKPHITTSFAAATFKISGGPESPESLPKFKSSFVKINGQLPVKLGYRLPKSTQTNISQNVNIETPSYSEKKKPLIPMFEARKKCQRLFRRSKKSLRTYEPKKLPPSTDVLLRSLKNFDGSLSKDLKEDSEEEREIEIRRPASPKYDEQFEPIPETPTFTRSSNIKGKTGKGFSKNLPPPPPVLINPSGSASTGDSKERRKQKISVASPRIAKVTQVGTPFSGGGRGVGPIDYETEGEIHAGHNLTLLGLECLALTPENRLVPNPKESQVAIVVYRVRDENLVVHPTDASEDITGVIVNISATFSDEKAEKSSEIPREEVHSKGKLKEKLTDQDIKLKRLQETISQRRKLGISQNITLSVVFSEPEMFLEVSRLVWKFDPDVILGYEIAQSSWGFLVKRSEFLGCPLLPRLSRDLQDMKREEFLQSKKKASKENEEEKRRRGEVSGSSWTMKRSAGFLVCGRIVLNVWQILRSELKLRHYGFESICLEVLSAKYPVFSQKQLTKWFRHKCPYSHEEHLRFRVIKYFFGRLDGTFAILDRLDIISRTSELAKTFGIRFISVLNRGSQYRVESLLMRIACTQDYILRSSSRQEVADQPAMESIPLVCEPMSQLYTSPVIVVDFQSLYPSIIIAYNMCFSTCLGSVPVGARAQRVREGGNVKFGVGELQFRPQLLSKLMGEDKIWVSPNGIAFVTPKERSGVLPRMLHEILSTRVMVKDELKKSKKAARAFKNRQKRNESMQSDPAENWDGGGISYQNTLNARQLALKLVANVTYGYTSAGFSGRMPCAEIADAIVETGRRTLEDARSFIESESKWDAKIVYGDTDSLFILLEGRTWKQAIDIGHEIVKAVTLRNPKPIKLKFEKVYHPCFLISKKRYVGMMYEDKKQNKPIFEAKGIETVRRDSCPLVAKLMASSLKMLFKTLDLSLVRNYLERQFHKVWAHKLPVTDFVFSKEVRLGTYRNPPPAAIVAIKRMRKDRFAEPLFAERVRYIVVEGDQEAKLRDLVVDPAEVVYKIDSRRRRVNAHYYLSRQVVPALARIFNLAGGIIKNWFDTMPRPRSTTQLLQGGIAEGTMRGYYRSTHCIVCDSQEKKMGRSLRVCSKCMQKPQLALVSLEYRRRSIEKSSANLDAICHSCCETRATQVRCEADCIKIGYQGRRRGREKRALDSITCENMSCPILYERHATKQASMSLRANIEEWKRETSGIASISLDW